MPSIFLDKSVKPTKAMVSDALGRSLKYWEELIHTLEQNHGKLTEEWKFYGKQSGWTLKLLLKKRNLFFTVHCRNYFRVAFIFGDRAVSAVEKSDLPVKLVRELKKARRYAEGRGLRIEVKKKTDIKNIITLVGIKVNN